MGGAKGGAKTPDYIKMLEDEEYVMSFQSKTCLELRRDLQRQAVKHLSCCMDFGSF